MKKLTAVFAISLLAQGSSMIYTSSVVHLEDLITRAGKMSSEELFEQEINHEGLTLVKFTATWCPPCKSYAPIFEDVAKQNRNVTVEGKTVAVKYISVDIDLCPTIAQKYTVMSIPTTIIYRNGKPVASFVGAKDKTFVVNKIKELAKN